jgi:hypothetical protein
MTSQQEGDIALKIYQANRDDQERMNRMLREFFADVREEERTAEFKRQMSCVSVEFPCVITSLLSPSPSLEAF